jgi:tetratricopeptide (TPR) repeat protein
VQEKQPTPALLQQALALHRAGRLAEADAIYRRILEGQPQHPDALHLSGLIAHQSGDHATALARIEVAIAANGGVADYHHNRGVVLLRLGRAAEAEASLRRALTLKPGYADAENALGNALQALGRPGEARRCYEAALRLKPDLIEAHNNLGNALRQLGEADAAIAQYRRALAARPAYVEAWCNLAAALQERGDLEEAGAAFGEALRHRADHAPAWRGLAAVQREQGDFAGALASRRRAAEVAPDNLRDQLDLGDALSEVGRSAEAEARYRAILARWPDATDAHLGLASLARGAGDDATARRHCAAALAIDADCIDALRGIAELDRAALDEALQQRMARLAADESRPLKARSHLCFALARAAESGGAYEQAFKHYAEGNALRRSEIEREGKRFDVTAHADYVDRQIATFTPALFERLAPLQNPSELPIFIVGMPRAGTTLCEQILASHSTVHGLGEQLDIQTMARVLPQRLAATGVSTLPYPECVAALTPDVVEPMVAAYLTRLRWLAPQVLRVTDKHPTNFRHLGLIAALLPRARIIHCRRAAMDSCFSCFTQDFEAPIPWAWDLTSLGQYYRQYDRLMRHWQSVVPVFDFVYEEVVADLPAVARRLVEFCGLPWEERCLSFHETERPVLTASRWQVRQPLYGSSVGKWRRYERHLAPLKAALAGEERPH